MAATAGSAVISLAFPLSSQLNSIYLLMVLRCVMGLCQSAFFPAAYVVFCRWLPERERSVLLPIMFIGSNIGNISTYFFSSHLISSSYGWPSVFYLSGLVCALVSLLWFVFGSNGPEDNWFISDEERRFIEKNVNVESSESNSVDDLELEDVKSKLTQEKLPSCCNNSSNANHVLCGSDKSNCRLKISSGGQETVGARGNKPAELANRPSWMKLFKSMPIWVLILSMYGNEWSNVVLLYELPTYLNTALNFPIERNGVINSFLQLTFAVASPLVSSLGAYLLENHVCGMRKLHVRKLFQSFACFGQLLCFVSVPICGSNRGLIIVFMFSAIIFRACANAGDIMVPGDLSQGEYTRRRQSPSLTWSAPPLTPVQPPDLTRVCGHNICLRQHRRQHGRLLRAQPGRISRGGRLRARTMDALLVDNRRHYVLQRTYIHPSRRDTPPRLLH